MQTPDLINGGFELFGSLFIVNHIRALCKSKQAYGVSLISTLFFGFWGLWNLYYYPHLSQPLSFAGGIAITLANLVWIGSIWWFRRKYPTMRFIQMHKDI